MSIRKRRQGRSKSVIGNPPGVGLPYSNVVRLVAATVSPTPARARKSRRAVDGVGCFIGLGMLVCHRIVYAQAGVTAASNSSASDDSRTNRRWPTPIAPGPGRKWSGKVPIRAFHGFRTARSSRAGNRGCFY